MIEKLEQADIVRKHLCNLINKTQAMLEKHTSFDRDDLTGRMITYFIFKQTDHAMSVMKLDPSMDAVLVARTMIEGVINLSWTLEKPDERVQNWFDYSSVYDFQLLEKKKKNGAAVSPEDEKEVTENYDKNAHTFLNKKGKPHESFRKGENLGNISKDNDGLKDFYVNYKDFSDWVHWGSQSLRNVIREDVETIAYYETEHPYRVPALMSAFASLLNIAAKTNEHFKLGQDQALNDVSNKLAEDLKISGMKF